MRGLLDWKIRKVTNRQPSLEELNLQLLLFKNSFIFKRRKRQFHCLAKKQKTSERFWTEMIIISTHRCAHLCIETKHKGIWQYFFFLSAYVHKLRCYLRQPILGKTGFDPNDPMPPYINLKCKCHLADYIVWLAGSVLPFYIYVPR
jgi:hypothetical protein